MERYARRFGRLLLILLMTLTAVGATPPQPLELLMLPRIANTTPERVLAGEFREQFEHNPSGEAFMMGRQPQWLMLIARRDFAADGVPQLLMTQPYKKSIEVWRPGDVYPLRRSTYGPNVDRNHSAQFHVVPLPNGLKQGDVIYLRAIAIDSRPSRFRIEPAEYVHRMDMSFGRGRTFILTSLTIVSLVALGFWIALQQRGYAYLALTLAVQVVTLATESGELRGYDWLVPFALDRRANILLNTLAALASVRFLMFFLSIPPMQPRVAKTLDICSLIFLGIIAVSLFEVWYATAMIGNFALLVVIATVVKAIAHAIRLKQREAYSLLIAWSPLMAVLVVKIGGMQSLWPMFEWVEFAFPAAMCVGGLGLIFGMTHKLHLLRREHETVRHRASHDGLTGVLTRAALQDALSEVVERSRSSGDAFCVVFFDIDHFKRINDEHGHAVGDEVLRIVAARTRNRLRPFDVFGRYGGDEMLIGLIGAPLDQALVIAEHVRKGVSDGPVVIEGRRLLVGLSLGVAQLRDGETLDGLLRRADAALYASKAEGRDRVTGDGLSLGSSALSSGA